MGLGCGWHDDDRAAYLWPGSLVYEKKKKEHFRSTSVPVMTLALQLSTFTGWTVALLTGLLGFLLPYPRPQSVVTEPELPPVEAIEVELSNESVARPDDAPPPVDLSEPIPEAPPLDAPPPVQVAKLTDAVAFALPTDALAEVVELSHASFSRVAPDTAHQPAPPPVQSLTFGRGEGNQPAPRYPRRAVREGQEGSVTVVFTVNERGSVVAAQLARGCPWPLLNEAALEVIRERWRFPSGGARRYEINIHFELRK